jgi:histidinol dehydrogenase
MRIERLTLDDARRLGGPAGIAAHLGSLYASPASVQDAVREIVERVRAEGEAAVIDYTRRFDTGGGEPKPLRVAPEELDAAIKQLPLDVVAGLQVAIANVAGVAQAGTRADATLDLAQGQRILLRELPVASAAVYVPGGRAPYASTVVMGVVTARAAGVLDVAVCAPPGPDGEIDAAILGTCRLCGVERVYRMGGAQAIAALAYGTDSVERVDVVVGPGNLYVQEAKRLLSATVGIDGFAGPSDLLVLLGADAGERAVELVALDLLAQAEHGEGTLVAAVATDAGVAERLGSQLQARLAEIAPDRPLQAARAAIAQVEDAAQAVEVANALAPEHLQLVGSELEALAWSVTAAACLLVGSGGGTAFSDYVAGSNHVLPTAGAARFASMLSARHFRRCMAEVHIGAEAAARLARAGAPIARLEGFEWHARSMEARIGDNLDSS